MRPPSKRRIGPRKPDGDAPRYRLRKGERKEWRIVSAYDPKPGGGSRTFRVYAARYVVDKRGALVRDERNVVIITESFERTVTDGELVAALRAIPKTPLPRSR